jgi:hypothetical protein
MSYTQGTRSINSHGSHIQNISAWTLGLRQRELAEVAPGPGRGVAPQVLD